MKKFTKKLISVILVIAMVFGNVTLIKYSDILPDFVSVKAKAYESDGFKYYIQNENGIEYAQITGTSKTGYIDIPSIVDGYPVKSIYKNAFYNNSGITSVVIPDSVTEISDSAFYNCVSLINVIINESSELISIGNSAFYGCSSLFKIYIPKKIESIGSDAFLGCNTLTFITVDSENKNFSNDENGNLYNKDKTELITYLKSNPANSFIVPGQVSVIADRAFYDVDNLELVEFNSELTKIGASAFYDCDNLVNVIMPESGKLSIIDTRAFCYCDLLESIVIPSSVTEINNQAFGSCSSLSSVEIKPDSKLQKIGENAFEYDRKLESIYLPSLLNDLGIGAFSACSGLKTVDFCSDINLKEIKKSTFSNSGVTKIVIPRSVELINVSSFNCCYSLASVSFESGSALKSICSSAFSNCKSLLNIVLPYGLESISRSAFYDSSLMYVHVPSSVMSIANENFNHAVCFCSDSENSFAKDYAEAKGVEFKICNGTHNFPKPSLKLINNKGSSPYGYMENFDISAVTENIPENMSVICSFEHSKTGISSDFVHSLESINSKFTNENTTWTVTARIKVDDDSNYSSKFLVDENGEYIEDSIEFKVRVTFFDQFIFTVKLYIALFILYFNLIDII